jgi:plastocyanin
VLNGYETESGDSLLSYQLGNETQGGVSIARNTVYAAIGTTSQPDGKIVALRPGGKPSGGGGGEQPPSGPGGGPGGGGGPVTATIVAGPQNLYYTQRIAAPVSGRLTFANLDTQAHDVVSRATAPDGSPLFRSPLVGTQQTGDVTGFNRAAPGQTYPFFCTIHPGMTGEVLATP